MGTSSDARRWLFRLLASLVYLVATLLVSLYLQGDHFAALAGGESHESAIRALVLPPPRTRLDDVGGLAEIKEDLRTAVLLPLQHPHLFYQGPAALRPPRGVLLHGPPGTGKTMLARAVAAESGVPFVALTAASMESKWHGESNKLVQAAFDYARKAQPCILFFDEVDGLGGRTRSELDQACNYTMKTELLRNLDGVGSRGGDAVVVIACTNCPDALDPALRRRLPHRVHVPRPDHAARVDILAKLTQDEPKRVPRSLLDAIAHATPHLTGSDLASLYADAAMLRVQDPRVHALVTSGQVADGQALLGQLGGLTRAHWSRALAQRGLDPLPPRASPQVQAGARVDGEGAERAA